MNSTIDRSSPTPRVAVVRAGWHAELVGRAVHGLHESVADELELVETTVPGAFEVPLMIRSLLETGRFDAAIAIGLVTDGGIYRHEFVADAVISGLMRVQLDTGHPVFSCVLTPHHFHEHAVHDDFFAAHLISKGREVGDAALATLRLRERLAA